MPRKLEVGEKLVECPICCCFHPQSFDGDCRDDDNRFPPPEDQADEAEFFDHADPEPESV
jgi:hypothetical protein